MQTYAVTVLGGVRPFHHPAVKGPERLAKLRQKYAGQDGIRLIIHGDAPELQPAAPSLAKPTLRQNELPQKHAEPVRTGKPKAPKLKPEKPASATTIRRLKLRKCGEGVPGIQRPVVKLMTGRYYRNLIAAGEACGGYAEGVRKVVEGLQATHRKQAFRDATPDEIAKKQMLHP